jgi:hypothetical protein
VNLSRLKKISGNYQLQGEKEKKKKPACLSPRRKEACHSIGTALLQNIAKQIGTQNSMMKSNKHTL